MYFFVILIWTLFRPVIHTKCGKSAIKLDRNSKIIGGENVTLGEFPWLVSLRRFNIHFCAGSVLDKDWVLTAGHCVNTRLISSPDDYTVVAGGIIIDENEPTDQISPVKKFFRHENYRKDFTAIVNDIALIRLSRSLNITGVFVRPICLPDPNQKFTGNCELAGWGRVHPTVIERTKVAQKVTVPLITNEECREVFPRLEESMVCTWYKEGGKGACKGDSGGPLMCLGAGKKYYLTGIISGGKECGYSPTINTKVSYFIEWIYNTTKSFNENNSNLKN